MLGVGTYPPPPSHPPSQSLSHPSSPNSENPARAKGVAGVSRGGQENGEERRGEESWLGAEVAVEEEEEEEEMVAEEETRDEGRVGGGEGRKRDAKRGSGVPRGAPPRV